MAEKTSGDSRREDESGVETEAQTESRNEILEGVSELQRVAEDRDRDTDKFFVVGIGASAGGLEALGELVKHVPLDSMAFVVVQHLAPHHDSVLTQLLSRTSKVQVQTATDGTPASDQRSRSSLRRSRRPKGASSRKASGPPGSRESGSAQFSISRRGSRMKREP